MAAVKTLVELGVLAAAAAPAVRLLLRRDLRVTAPRLFVGIAAGIATLAVLAAEAALRSPLRLDVLASGAGVLGLAHAWRARSSYGRTRGLPPGSLSIFESIEALVDRRFYAERFARFGPVFKTAQLHQGVVCVLGTERGQRLLRERRSELGPSVLPFDREIPGGFLRYMEGETYERYGSLFRLALAGPVVREAEGDVAAVIRRELARMAEASSRAPDGAVGVERFLERIVFASFARVLFGFAPGTAAFAELERLHEPLRRQRLDRRLSPSARSALEELRALVFAEAERIRKQGATGGSSRSALEAIIGAGAWLPDRTCADNLLFILKISSSNVESLLLWIVKLMGDHRLWLERLRAERDGGGPLFPEPGLADRIVSETLRLEQSEYLYRRIRQSFRWEGFSFPQGWLLRICVKESHRLEEAFENPLDFDPDRFLGPRIPRSRYSPFGSGEHACNGVDLTYAIARSFLIELSSAFDWTIVRDGPLERGRKHWSHWRPSSRLRISIAHRGGATGSDPGDLRARIAT